MTPPDSDAREVMQFCSSCGFRLSTPPPYHVCPPTQPATSVPVVISLDLAQRILAALERGGTAPDWSLAIATELRAVIGK